MNFEEIKKELEREMEAKQYLHSIGTMEEAVKLARIYNSDSEKAKIAGLLHDCGKEGNGDNLTHAEKGAELAIKKYGIKDREIIDAIKYHTRGRVNMTLLEKIVFIADKIEPNRTYDGVEELRSIAYSNLNLAIIKSLESTIKYVKERNMSLNIESVNTLNYLKGGKMISVEKSIQTILEACDNKKAYNFVVLDVSKISSITDYFIICSGSNEKQTVAIADEVLEKGEKEGINFYYKEGFETGRWILLATDDIMVHIFHKEEREIYDLESLWYDDNSLDVEQYGIKNWK